MILAGGNFKRVGLDSLYVFIVEDGGELMLREPNNFRLADDSDLDGDKCVYEDLTHLVSISRIRYRAIMAVALSPPVPFRLYFVRWISAGD